MELRDEQYGYTIICDSIDAAGGGLSRLRPAKQSNQIIIRLQ